MPTVFWNVWYVLIFFLNNSYLSHDKIKKMIFLISIDRSEKTRLLMELFSRKCTMNMSCTGWRTRRFGRHTSTRSSLVRFPILGNMTRSTANSNNGAPITGWYGCRWSRGWQLRRRLVSCRTPSTPRTSKPRPAPSDGCCLCLCVPCI